ncbi:MAG: hypothetical protein RIG84_11965 [Roseovarius sp.]
MTAQRLLLIAMLVLLGNGLRSVVASSVFVSEGSFASFLSITVEATAVVMELLMGAVLVSLLVAPWIMRRIAPWRLAILMCLLAGAALAGLGGMFYASPPVDLRVAGVILLFPLIGFALATLAPISQIWTSRGGPHWDKTLTGVWSVAMPLAFLVTPQLVRVVAPRYGLDVFFAGLAALTVAMIGAILLMGRATAAATDEKSTSPALLPAPLMRAALLALVVFEGLTFVISLETISSPLVWPLAAGLIASGWYLFLVWRARPARPAPAEGQGSRRIACLFISLFLLNVATTGFFDTAYLVRHACSTTLIADRATMAALAQVIAATATAAMLARWQVHTALIAAGLFIAAIGLASYLAYPGVLAAAMLPIPENALFVASRLFTGFGTGMATTATVFAVSQLAGKNGGAQLFLAFVIIIGTEVGLEGFEVLSQIVTQTAQTTVPPYAAIFLLQAIVALLAIMPLSLATRGTRQDEKGLRRTSA